jgi:hypothetical protein
MILNAVATPWTGEQKTQAQAEATIRNRYNDLKNRLKLAKGKSCHLLGVM